MIRQVDDFQEGDQPPQYYCPNHGLKMNVKPVKRYDLMTGKKITMAFESSCPRFFCGQTILTGVIRPRPNIAPSPQRRAP